MIKVILLDLDNTLIRNEDVPFALAFLEALEQFGLHRYGKANLSLVFRKGMKALRATKAYDSTNHAVLCATIAESLETTVAEVDAGLAEFYATSYQTLSGCVEPQQHASEVMKSVRALGYRAILATNPIYSREAIEKRLEWGQLNPKDFEFISHSGNMHFAKPDPAYYAELLARAGVEPDEVIAVGDNAERDIDPARQIGIPTFQYGQDGDLADFERKIQHEAEQEFHRLPLHPDMIQPQYRGNVGALFGLIDSLNPKYWHQHPDPNEWSPIQIVCHLAESETTVQRARLMKIRDENNPFLAQPKTPPGPDQFVCIDSEGYNVAHQFAAERQKTLDWLETLSAEDWLRPARHSIFGPTTLLEMAQFTAQHDRLHVEQLCQTIGKCS